MSVVETYRVVTGTTRALLYFERSDEVCECVAEMILDRRLRAGLRSPPGALRKLTAALRDGVRFMEDARGLIVPASTLNGGGAQGRGAQGGRAQGGGTKQGPAPEARPRGRKKPPRRPKRR